MRDDRTMFLFVFADQTVDGAAIDDIRAQKTLLRKRFGKVDGNVRRFWMHSMPRVIFILIE